MPPKQTIPAAKDPSADASAPDASAPPVPSGDTTAPSDTTPPAAPPAPAAPASVGAVATDNITSLRAPEGCTACSVDGVQYLVEDGRVTVDERHAEKLLGAGFSY